MEFEWDDTKAELNERKHGVSFTEAMSVFADPLALTGYDLDHSADEDRYLTMGESSDNRLLVVSHSDRDEPLWVIRIISAREATRAERRDYEDGNFP